MEKSIEIDSLNASDIYRILSGAVCPRPIAWVSTTDKSGCDNLAPFSFFNVVSVNPPILGFSPLLNAKGERKDTVCNIIETKECFVHIVEESMVSEMNATSLDADRCLDEFEYTGLNKSYVAGFSVPKIKDASVAFGCRLHDVIEFGNDPLSGSLVLVRVDVICIKDDVVSGKYIDSEKLRPLGRMAGKEYIRVSDRFELDRPS